MKKTLLFTFVLFLAINATAQEKRHEISVGTGFLNSNIILNALSGFLTTGLTAGTYSENPKYYGTFYAGYKYALSDRFLLGGTFLYDRTTADALVNQGKIGTFSKNFYTIAPEMSYTYIKLGMFKMYALLGAGLTVFTQTFNEISTGDQTHTNSTHFNFQLTPVGLKFGRQFGAFAEIGFGYKGILSAGLYLKL